MGSFIGIDLGTTFSALARIDATGRSVIVHVNGANLTPSCVAIVDSKTVEVGTEQARKTFGLDEGNAAGRFKRKMGTSEVYKLAGQRFTPTDLSALVLQKLVNDDPARQEIGDIEEVVVTVPANFANDAREATLQAAKKANLNIRYIINEPTAAALCYLYRENVKLQGTYAVYDLGGGTFDISIIRVEGHEVEVLCSNGIHELGGMDFDEELMKIVARKYREIAKDELERGDYTNLEAEGDKKSLSDRNKITTRVNRKAIDITRQEFEEAISAFVTQAEMLCESTIGEAGLNVSDIREVLCAGGSTRIPMVRESIKRMFGRDPICSVNVDEVVALGAALYAAYKGDRSKLSDAQNERIGRLDVAECANKYYGTIALGRDLSGQPSEVNSILIEKNSKIPCSVTKSYSTINENQTAVDCSVTECSVNETDLRFVTVRNERQQLDLPPGRPAGQEIEVTFSYDANQIMRCFFIDVETQKKCEVVISLTNQEDPVETDINKFTVE